MLDDESDVGLTRKDTPEGGGGAKMVMSNDAAVESGGRTGKLMNAF
jgi:hypothetical protein